jgi:hypothetical protein
MERWCEKISLRSFAPWRLCVKSVRALTQSRKDAKSPYLKLPENSFLKTGGGFAGVLVWAEVFAFG